MIVNSRPKNEIEERSKAIRADFVRRYDTDLLRQELFDAQSGLCAICKEAVQSADSVVCAIDHAVPVFLYASWDFPIEEASGYANARRNLLVTHIACNTVKKHADFEEFVERLDSGEINLEIPKVLSGESIQKIRDRLTIQARKNGKKGGSKNANSGHCARIAHLGGRALSHEVRVRAGRRNVETGHIKELGRSQGLENVRNGHLSRLRTPEHQRTAGLRAGALSVEKSLGIHAPGYDKSKGGRACVEKGVGIAALTPEQRSAAGKKGGAISGALAVSTGRVFEMGKKAGQVSRESGHAAALGNRYGRINGQKNVESGWIQELGRIEGRRQHENKTGIFAPENRGIGGRAGGPIANHNRYHVTGCNSRKGNWVAPKPNPRCALCSEQGLIVAYA